MIKEHRDDAQLCRIELGKDVVRIIRSIIVADAGMVATDDEMRATIILAHQRVENGLARTSVAHRGRQYPEYDPVFWIVMLQQHFVTAHAYIGGNIIALCITYQGMQVEAIHRL